MYYMKHKNLIKNLVIPNINKNLQIYQGNISIQQKDMLRLLKVLNNNLPSDTHFLYEELQNIYCHQIKENTENNCFTAPINLQPYAKKHGLIKTMKQLVKE